MSVLVITGEYMPPVDASYLAAQALAVTLAADNATDMAVTRSPQGQYVIMPYALWETQNSMGAERWELKGMAWNTAANGREARS